MVLVAPEEKLLVLARILESAVVPHAQVDEDTPPYSGALVAIGIAPGAELPAAARHILRPLKLWGRRE